MDCESRLPVGFFEQIRLRNVNAGSMIVYSLKIVETFIIYILFASVVLPLLSDFPHMWNAFFYAIYIHLFDKDIYCKASRFAVQHIYGKCIVSKCLVINNFVIVYIIFQNIIFFHLH